MKTSRRSNLGASFPGTLRSLAVAALWILCFALTEVAMAQPNLRGFKPSTGIGFNVVGAATAGAPARFNEKIKVQFRVQNNGTTTAPPSVVRFYLSPDAEIDPDADVLLKEYGNSIMLGVSSFSVPELPDGANYFEDELFLRLPHLTHFPMNGAIYLGMVVDADDDVDESNENDNRNRGHLIDREKMFIDLVNGIDLTGVDGRNVQDFPGSEALQNVYFDVRESEAYWGRVIRIKGGVMNQGNGSITSPFKVKFYLSNDQNFYQGTLLGTITVDPNSPVFADGFGAGDAINFPGLFVALPETAPYPLISDYYIGMMIDADNAITEVSEVNNGGYGDADLQPYLTYQPEPIRILTPQPNIEVSRVTEGVDFGEVANDGTGGLTGEQTVTIQNLGAPATQDPDSNLFITDIRVEGSPAFRVEAVTSNLQSVLVPYNEHPVRWSGQETWTVHVEFDPTVNGPATGSLVIESTDPDEPVVTVSLSGNAVGLPDLRITDSVAPANDGVLSLGGVLDDGPGGASASEVVTLSNHGSAAFQIQGIAIPNPASGFLIESVESSVSGPLAMPVASYPLPPGNAESLLVTVKFDPAQVGAAGASLEISSDVSGGDTRTVALTGTGLLPGDIEITDSVAPGNDLALAFGDVHADGAGLEKAEATVVIGNAGEAELTVPVGGITLTGADASHFEVVSIISDSAGWIDLSSESATVQGNSEEAWTVMLRFDPATAGPLAAQLRIESDDPDENPAFVDLSGTGLDEPDLDLRDSGGSPFPEPWSLSYGPHLNDGTGERVATRSFRLRNIGTQPLTVDHEGIALTAGSGSPNAQRFEVLSVESSTVGSIDMAATDPSLRQIAPTQTEEWTISVAFDPDADTAFSDTLTVASDDPDEASVSVALSGEGARPRIVSVMDEIVEQNVSAGTLFELEWEDEYVAGNAMVNLYYDTDNDPSSGLVPIAENIPEDDDADVFHWIPEETLAGTTIWIYATARDGIVTDGAYADNPLHIEGEGSFQVLSPLRVTSADYAYEYEYLGETYTGVTTLGAGETIVRVDTPTEGGGSVTHTFKVDLVDSLLDQTNITYDSLNRVETQTNGNGITTTYTYDVMGRLVRTEATNGRVVTWDYDQLGRRVKMQDYTGTTFYDWDDLDRMRAIHYSLDEAKGGGDDLVLRYSNYDNAGRLTEMIYPGGEVVRHTYDAGGRLTSVDLPNRSMTWVYSYDDRGLLSGLMYPNGINLIYEHNDEGYLSGLVYSNAIGDVVASFRYLYNSEGIATECLSVIDGEIEKEWFFYDSAGNLQKLVRSSGDEILDESVDDVFLYSHDALDNRLSKEVSKSGAVTERYDYIYGSENRLLTVTEQLASVVTSYVYDLDGNIISRVRNGVEENWKYDDRSMMTEARFPGGWEVMSYNGDRHIMQLESALKGVERYVVSPKFAPYVIVEARSNSGIDLHFYGIDNSPIGIYSSERGRFEFFLIDRLRSVRVVTGIVGDVLDTNSFGAFGEEL